MLLCRVTGSIAICINTAQGWNGDHTCEKDVLMQRLFRKVDWCSDLTGYMSSHPIPLDAVAYLEHLSNPKYVPHLSDPRRSPRNARGPSIACIASLLKFAESMPRHDSAFPNQIHRMRSLSQLRCLQDLSPIPLCEIERHLTQSSLGLL